MSESSSKELLDKTKDKVKEIAHKEKEYLTKVGNKTVDAIKSKYYKIKQDKADKTIDNLSKKAKDMSQQLPKQISDERIEKLKSEINDKVQKAKSVTDQDSDKKSIKEYYEEPLDESVKNKEDEDKELAKARSDKKLLTSEANAASERAFPVFKEKFEKKLSGKTDNYSKNRLQEFESFCKKNKSAPKVKGFDFESTDYAMIFFGGYYPSDDWILFYQDEVAKEMNKSEELKKAGYRFGTEDYPGIFCYC